MDRRGTLPDHAVDAKSAPECRAARAGCPWCHDPEGPLTDRSITDLLDDPATRIAVVGATDTPGKYGGIVYRDLKEKGFRVLAVNPNSETVDGDPAHDGLADLPERPDLVAIVVPPAVARTVLGEARRLGLDRVWLQPGSEDAGVLAYLEEHGFSHLAGACIMVRSHAVG